ncbi:hypothetical protein AMATHDRAFT_83943 [Amanita thiersii Skay4041]|uniref:Opi1-domain-containing protein n=1 Tax=Amanita thiersii Skay4041 TaxID=703135 RepID=A0A2A9NQL3_9AGAR|nr:hypothetical protein AMATHDRAFT_83943 [Amanita thiersii Skay4041]
MTNPLPPPPSSSSSSSIHTLIDQEDENVRIAVSALGDMRNATSRYANSDSVRSPLSPSSPSPSASPSLPLSPSPRNSASSLSPSPITDNPHAPVSSSPTNSLVHRVSHLPLVNSVLRTYEQGKASSRVVKYGAEMMESSVRSISRPVIDRLPVNVNQLDEFACRQLDRLDRYRRMSNTDTAGVSPPSASATTMQSPQDSGRPKPPTKTFDGSVLEEPWEQDVHMSSDSHSQMAYDQRDWDPTDEGSTTIPRWLEATTYRAPPDSRSSTPTQLGDEVPNSQKARASESPRMQNRNPERQVAQRSRWQAVLLEAGGLSAALSDENMRRLKYCLHCLQYATSQIDAQILILRDFIAGLQPLPPPTSPALDPSPSRQPVSQAHMRTLTDVRRDLVQTIRQVVDVVSKYAGGALPEPARTRVRGFILKLPHRWASKAGVPPSNLNGTSATTHPDLGERETVNAAASGTGAVRRANRRAPYRERGAGSEANGSRSTTSSRAPSPASPRVPRGSMGHIDTAQGAGGEPAEGSVSAGTAVVAAQRILTLATESLDMMRGVTGVMRDSLDRADAWVNRLRTIGIQRNGSAENPLAMDSNPSNADSALNPSRSYRHQRRRSGSSNLTVDDDRESYFRGDTGLASPTSIAGSVSGSSTAYSLSYVTGGNSSVPSTPSVGTYTPSTIGTQSPGGGFILPLLPLGAMNLGPGTSKARLSITKTGDKFDTVGEEKMKVIQGLGLEDVRGEKMDVDA